MAHLFTRRRSSVQSSDNSLFASSKFSNANFNLLFFYVFYYIVTIIWGKVSILFYFLKQIGGNKQNVPGQCCPTDRMLANATEEQNVVFITLDLN